MQKEYKHIFFDLDHTLWDFEKNANETLEHLYFHYKLKEFGIAHPDLFVERYHVINDKMWDLYSKKLISKDELREKRFENALIDLGMSPQEIPDGIWQLYLEICPTKTNLFDGAKDLLEYLNGKYTLSIITNGFEETQHKKLKHSDIGKYFTHMLSSEKFGIAKPDPKIFNHLLQLNKASNTETIMIGDNMETDIKGAKAAAIDHVFFNPEKNNHNHDVEKEVHHLLELKEII